MRRKRFGANRVSTHTVRGNHATIVSLDKPRFLHGISITGVYEFWLGSCWPQGCGLKIESV